MTSPRRITIVRHAPVISDGCFYGRRDLPARCDDPAAFLALRQAFPAPQTVWLSPALRCMQTAAAIWPDMDLTTARQDPDLWEQDFGAWEGLPYDALPDIGVKTGAELSDYRPKNGESFADLYRRTIPVLEQLMDAGGGVIVAHAGTMRAALSLVDGEIHAGLAYHVPNLSYVTIEAKQAGMTAYLGFGVEPAKGA